MTIPFWKIRKAGFVLYWNQIIAHYDCKIIIIPHQTRLITLLLTDCFTVKHSQGTALGRTVKRNRYKWILFTSVYFVNVLYGDCRWPICFLSSLAMEYQPNNMPFISHGIIDHKGGELTLGELGITVSIPEGAIPIRMRRSVVTLRVPAHDTPRIPVREGEVVITPAVECSLTQELLKPATVVLPHCSNHHERKDDSSVILYTKRGPGTKLSTYFVSVLLK